MKKLFLFLALLVAAPFALAADFYHQTVSLSDANSHASTELPGEKQWSVQCDGEVRYRVCDTSTCTAVSTDAKLTIDAFSTPVDITHAFNSKFIALIRTGSSTVTCYVYTVVNK